MRGALAGAAAGLLTSLFHLLLTEPVLDRAIALEGGGDGPVSRETPGRPLAELDLTHWWSDPAYAAHGGESLLALLDRVRDMLEQWHDRPGRLVPVTHAAVIRAAVARPGGWRAVRVNAPVAPVKGSA